MDAPFAVIDSQFENPFETKPTKSDSNGVENPFEVKESKTTSKPTQATTPSTFINTSNLTPDRKYNIIDFYWMLNDKVVNNQKLTNGEAGICVVGFNANFGNLRVEFRSIKEDSFHGTAIVHTNCPRLTSFNIYSEEAKRILHYLTTQNNNEILLIERIISVQNWTPNETYLKWDFQNRTISIKTIDKTNNNGYWITLNQLQTLMFIDALKYMVDGRAWSDMLNSK